MNILVLYDKFSTYTNAVFDHLAALADYSEHQHHYAHAMAGLKTIPLEAFDCLVIHYSVRVAWGNISAKDQKRLRNFSGKKVLFVQDEYDCTNTTSAFIEYCQLDLVFTCVPQKHISKVYPPERFCRTRFVTNLTGYVTGKHSEGLAEEGERSIDIGYRGRELPFWYGDLGQEKKRIADGVLELAASSGLKLDISSQDSARIYGDEWPIFLKSCKATLGTESGCNIFDYDGGLKERVRDYLKEKPQASYNEVKRDVLKIDVEPKIMNQVSPRLFEAVEYGTVLILFEGEYSDIFDPWRHYIPLKKDFSNFEEVINTLRNPARLRAIAEQAYRDIYLSGEYSFERFVKYYDAHLDGLCDIALPIDKKLIETELCDLIAPYPERVPIIKVGGIFRYSWKLLPYNLKCKLKPIFVSAFLSIKKTVRRIYE